MKSNDIADSFNVQGKVWKLLQASSIPASKKNAVAQMILSSQKFVDLIKGSRNSDLVVAEAKLSGRRTPALNDTQRSIVTVTQHLYDFENAVSPWVGGYVAGQIPYAIEHVLGQYNAQSKSFTGSGTGVDLANLSIKDLRTLKEYCSFSVALQDIYDDAKSPWKSSFEKGADEVAKGLVGRVLTIKGVGDARIIEDEGFETDDEVTKMRNCMLALPGQISIMPFRGLSFVNIGTRTGNHASCVMLRSVEVDGELYDGPGKTGKILGGSKLEGILIGTKGTQLSGKTAPSGFMPGEGEYSTGKYRIQ